jgi:hypothetical protein
MKVGYDNLDPKTRDKCSNIFFKFMASRMGIPKNRGFM